MRYLLIVVTSMFCMSCLQDDNPDVVEGVGIDAKEDITAQKLWVCHHPGSKFHNQLCVDDLYPNGCYVYGDSHKFCWLLTREECYEESNYAEIQACELFENVSEDFMGTEDPRED